MSSILTRQGANSDGPVVTHCGVNDVFQFAGHDTVRTVKRPSDISIFGDTVKPRSSSQDGRWTGQAVPEQGEG